MMSLGRFQVQAMGGRRRVPRSSLDGESMELRTRESSEEEEMERKLPERKHGGW